MINRNAIFSDETLTFKTPYEPSAGDIVTLRLRTLKNDVLRVTAVINGVKQNMTKESESPDEIFDYFTTSFKCPPKQVRYYFAIYDDDDKICYNRLGCVENHQAEYSFGFVPGNKVPDWAKGTVYYQIFPDRFYNGDPKNDVTDNEYYYAGAHAKKIHDWFQIPAERDIHNFYGGDLQGVKEKLDYLQWLGVETINFNPLFVSPSNHKYDTQDYDYIDPHFAVIEDDNDHAMQDWEKDNSYAFRYIARVTSKKNLEKSNAFFAELVKDIHSRGMRVVLDGVFNHCGSFNKWLDREGIYSGKDGFEEGAYQSPHSPYREFFKFKTAAAHSAYEGWWDHQTLPKLNYEKSPRLEEYILSTGEKWVSAPFGCDGWRLDVAADLGHSAKYNHGFWQKFHARVRAVNPEAVIFAEHYGTPESWLTPGEWDSVMNYDAFMEPVTWFLTGMEKHSDGFDESKLLDGKQFFESMKKNMSRLPRPALDAALNQLSNHDHSRFLTRTNRTVGRLSTMGAEAAEVGVDRAIMRLAVLIQMTWVGSPGIYYGDEAGQVGWTDPDNRRTYPWGFEDRALLEFHRAAIRLRRRIKCLRRGSLKQIDAGNGYIAYARFDRDDCAVIVINAAENDVCLSVPVWEAGIPRSCDNLKRVFLSRGEEHSEAEECATVKYGRLFLSVAGKSACVYHYNFKED